MVVPVLIAGLVDVRRKLAFATSTNFGSFPTRLLLTDGVSYYIDIPHLDSHTQCCFLFYPPSTEPNIIIPRPPLRGSESFL